MKLKLSIKERLKILFKGEIEIPKIEVTAHISGFDLANSIKRSNKEVFWHNDAIKPPKNFLANIKKRFNQSE